MSLEDQVSKLGLRLRRAAIVGLAVLGFTVGSVVMASPASASATKCAFTSTIRIQGVTVPTGQYCFSVLGSGTRIDFTSGSWNGPWVKYPAERVTFSDTSGRSYASWTTYSGTGTTYGYRYWRSGISGTAKVGNACGEFMSYGTTLAKICVNIG